MDKNDLKAIKKYRNYLIKYQDMKDPMRESYHHIALGNATFIERVKEKMEHLGQRREIPSTRFQSEYDVATIIARMTQVLHIERSRIFDKKRGNLHRSLAIYFIKQFTPLSLSKISEGQIDYKNTSSESSLLTRTVKRRIDG